MVAGMADIAVTPARIPEDVDTVRALFREYAAGLGVDLSFQAFDDELRELPGKYAAPAGALLLAWHHDVAVGCVAMRPHDAMHCEMKRLYVHPSMRGAGLGRTLVREVCARARAAGYARMRLDTLPSMVEARGLYGTLGFVAVAPYIFNPVPGAAFLELDLTAPSNK